MKLILAIFASSSRVYSSSSVNPKFRRAYINFCPSHPLFSHSSSFCIMASLPLLVCFILCTYNSLAHGGNEEHVLVAVPTSSYSEPAATCSTSRGTCMI